MGAVLYARVSTPDWHLKGQLYDLRRLAVQRGFGDAREHCDRGISIGKVNRTGLDSQMRDAQ